MTAATMAASALVGCSDRDGRDPDAEPFDFPAGDLLVPGDVDGYDLLHVQPASRWWLDDGFGPLVVTRFEGEVATVATASAADALARTGVADMAPDERVPAIGDRPTVQYGWTMAPLADTGSTRIAWQATDDLIVAVASRSLDLDDLVRLAEAVEVDAAAGTVAAPGDVVGEIPASWAHPRPGVAAAYEQESGGAGSGRVEVRTVPADRTVQEAYLVLAAPDGSIDESTHTSCCAGPIPPRRTIDVGGREATAAALTADVHMVVLHGDHGGVLLIEAGRYTPVPGDGWIADAVAALTPVAPDDFTPIGTTTTTPPIGTILSAEPSSGVAGPEAGATGE